MFTWILTVAYVARRANSFRTTKRNAMNAICDFPRADWYRSVMKIYSRTIQVSFQLLGMFSVI
jgi:hypothetical protein